VKTGRLRLTGSDGVVGGRVRSNSCLGEGWALDGAEHAGDGADGGHDACV